MRYPLLASLLLVGCYFPTSIAGSRSDLLYYLQFALSCAILTFMAWKFGYSENSLFAIAGVIIVLTVFTFLFGLHLPLIGLGNLPAFAAIPLMCAVQPPPTKKLLVFASLVNISIGTLLIIGVDPVKDFFIAHYGDFYDDLVPQMLDMHKPVLFFASHSIAGFFLYLFFWANWRSFLETKLWFYFLLALGHFGLCIATTSHTSLFFACVALAQMLWFSVKTKPKLTIASATAVIVCAAWFTPQDVRDDIADGLDTAKTFWLDTNRDTRQGFWGRFGSEGNMRETIVYIEQHPFAPIGLGSHPDFALVDSGLLHLWIRGSVFLVLLIYGCLWYFCRRVGLTYLFVVTILFEVGFSILMYRRTICLLPLVVAWARSSRERL